MGVTTTVEFVNAHRARCGEIQRPHPLQQRMGHPANFGRSEEKAGWV
jgi:hypothetical protein